MHDLTELLEGLKEVKELKKKIFDCYKSEVNTKGFECINIVEGEKVTDMIKDLAETEKNCMEALYYQKVIEAMVNYEEPRYGYNPNRYASGRYAPKGSGTRMGYLPHMPYLKYEGREMDPQDYMYEAMMGYSPSRGDNPGHGMSMGTHYDGEDRDSRYGQAYNDYKMTRRHYTDTRSMEDKKEMDRHAEEHIKDTITTVRDIWKDADPSLKKEMKEDFMKLVNEMDA